MSEHEDVVLLVQLVDKRGLVSKHALVATMSTFKSIKSLPLTDRYTGCALTAWQFEYLSIWIVARRCYRSAMQTNGQASEMAQSSGRWVKGGGEELTEAETEL